MCILIIFPGKHLVLSDEAEEVAGFYARMIEHEYASKDIFNRNFMEDWKKVMSDDERKVIKDLRKCNFKEMFDYFQRVSCFCFIRSIFTLQVAI